MRGAHQDPERLRARAREDLVDVAFAIADMYEQPGAMDAILGLLDRPPPARALLLLERLGSARLGLAALLKRTDPRLGPEQADGDSIRTHCERHVREETTVLRISNRSEPLARSQVREVQLRGVLHAQHGRSFWRRPPKPSTQRSGRRIEEDGERHSPILEELVRRSGLPLGVEGLGHRRARTRRHRHANLHRALPQTLLGEAVRRKKPVPVQFHHAWGTRKSGKNSHAWIWGER